MGISKRIKLLFLSVGILWNLVSVASMSAQTYLYNQAGLGVGNKPAGVTTADFNGDGCLDLAVVNAADNTVSVLLSGANGSFAHKVDYPVGNSPVAVVSGDFNGDHIVDLAVINNQDNTVSILLGLGDGTFKNEVTYATGDSPVAIAIADFNSDGKLDLAVADQASGAVSVLLGLGNGAFQMQSATTTVSSPIAIATGDFNNDGKPDLVAVNSQGSLSLLLNDGKGGFTGSGFSIGPSAGGLAVGDFNNDGNLDFVVAMPASDELQIFLGNGSGSFQSLSTLITASPVTVAAGDFNHDGKLDLIVGAGGGYPSSILVLLGLGNGTFRKPLYNGFSGTAQPMVIGDFNNDNHLDLATIDNINNQVTIFLGSGNGKIGGHADITLPASGGIAGATAAEFIEGSSLDAAVAQFDQNSNGIRGFIAVLPGNGNGTFARALSTPVSNIGIGQMVAGDFDGDGTLDVATSFVPATGGISVVLGSGNGKFRTPISSPVQIPLNVQKMIGGDFNDDGKTDLALLSLDSSNTFSPLYVLLSNGDGTFQPNLVDNVPGIATSLATGDLNHDGILDLVVTDSQGGVNPSVLVFLGKGNGTFGKPTSYKTGTLFSNDVKVADFNGDGHPDLAVGTEQGIFVFRGNGNGTFSSPIETLTSSSIETMNVGDFNGDGKPDLSFVGPAIGFSVALGKGDGTFQSPIEFQPTYYPRSDQIPIGDFNGDGSSDLIQFSSSDTLAVSPQTASVWSSAPTVAYSSSKLTFGQYQIGTSSPPQSLVLTNVGNAPLLISKVAILGKFSETNNCTITLAVGQQCTVEVTFRPSAKGTANGKLELTDNGTGGSQVILLSGTGT